MTAVRRILRRLRLAAPWYLLIPPAVIFLLWQGMLAFLGDRAEPAKHFVSVAAMYAAVAFFAVWRSFWTNPYARSGYRAWLATTPWSVDRPLPFGPIELDWPDVAVLGAMMALNGMIPGHRSAGLLAVFFFFHALALIPTIYGAANHVPAYAALFGLGLMARLWEQPWACATTGVVVYFIVYDGLRITLGRFPEPGDLKTTADLAKFDPETAGCGWPYDRLLREPGDPPSGFPGVAASGRDVASIRTEKVASRLDPEIVDYLIWSLLLGWWISSLGPLAFPGPRYPKLLAGVAAFVIGSSGVVRLMTYTSRYLPPISFWGRIRTLRWIIPGHDVVYLGPLLSTVIPATTVGIGLWREVPWEVVGPTAIAAALFIALAAPPRLRLWRLVGTHRIAREPRSTMSPGVED